MAINKNTKPDLNYSKAVGRRKTAIARVRLYNGKGDSLTNDLPIGEYFPGELLQSIYMQPLKVCGLLGKYYVTAKVVGGGKHAQAQAVAHGISRALVLTTPETKPPLKSNGLMTRDPRMKERRKPGYAQSARAKKQSPKR
jgi:small subunit ribosomal protein S9